MFNHVQPLPWMIDLKHLEHLEPELSLIGIDLRPPETRVFCPIKTGLKWVLGTSHPIGCPSRAIEMDACGT